MQPAEAAFPSKVSWERLGTLTEDYKTLWALL